MTKTNFYTIFYSYESQEQKNVQSLWFINSDVLIDKHPQKKKTQTHLGTQTRRMSHSENVINLQNFKVAEFPIPKRSQTIWNCVRTFCKLGILRQDWQNSYISSAIRLVYCDFKNAYPPPALQLVVASQLKHFVDLINKLSVVVQK